MSRTGAHRLLLVAQLRVAMAPKKVLSRLPILPLTYLLLLTSPRSIRCLPSRASLVPSPLSLVRSRFGPSLRSRPSLPAV